MKSYIGLYLFFTFLRRRCDLWFLLRVIGLNMLTPVGLVFNGQRLFQLAADGDQRIKLEGDVQLEIKPLRAPNFRYQTTSCPKHAF